MGSFSTAALKPIRDLIAAAMARADLGVTNAAAAHARADQGVSKADTAQATANGRITEAHGDGRYSRLGMGQVPHSVSRSAGTTHRNLSGKPIFVMIATSGGGSVQHQISENGSTWRNVGYATSNGMYRNVSYMVPHGHYYRIASASGPTIHSWIEYR